LFYFDISEFFVNLDSSQVHLICGDGENSVQEKSVVETEQGEAENLAAPNKSQHQTETDSTR
jgi:hypothetical protein